jgi:GDP-4-dehydro-6-deoxy-D-mannose reductase
VRLADLVAGMVERARVKIRIERDPERMRPADLPYLVGDPRAIERDTGWRATIPLERTLDDVVGESRRDAGVR